MINAKSETDRELLAQSVRFTYDRRLKSCLRRRLEKGETVHADDHSSRDIVSPYGIEVIAMNCLLRDDYEGI